MPRLRSLLAVSLMAFAVSACTRDAAPNDVSIGPRVVGLRGEVLDTTRAQRLHDFSALHADARFDIKSDAAMTVLLANGCVIHVVGPTEVSFETLSTMMPEACTESLDAQVALLGGIKGATVTLRERTAAAGQDPATFHERVMPQTGRDKAPSARSTDGDARGASERQSHAADDSNAQPAAEPMRSERDGVPMKKEAAGASHHAANPSPPVSAPPVVAGRANAADKAEADAEAAVVVDDRTKAAPEEVRLQQNQGPKKDRLQPAGVAKAMDIRTRARPVGLLLRSRALEKLFADPARAVCRAALVKDGTVAIHAHIENGRIVEVTLASGDPLPCQSGLVGQALPVANGVAVARLTSGP